ncbi:hypothetical protein COW46_04530 [Candidatus Gracilibacteria bacterium CG17_big_fil_post_rev_8_21_14_2_50_48_13]|nr:MAG: hypothetical protein COW46_04530 [Candidatus Gracilibacteria bacterium CG17_big_fil_post_rev_8_21_14_2_50_48_13]
MDDTNQQNLQGANPAQGGSGDASLPWMSFSPDPTVGDGAAAAGGATTGDDSTSTSLPGGFDPFGNPFGGQATDDSVTAAFAPSTTDGSSLTPSEATPFTPSEPSAFTPAPATEVQPTEIASEATVPAEETIPAWDMADAETPTSTGTVDMSGQTDSLSMLSNLKAQFDKEEEEFNEQIKQHNDNIQYEKDAIASLRSERSNKLAKMRKVVEGLQDILGGEKREQAPERRDRPRHEDNRRSEKGPSKPRQHDARNSSANDLLAA